MEMDKDYTWSYIRRFVLDSVSRLDDNMEGCESEMSVKEYVLSPQALVMVQGSSKGTQPKYYERGYWYKVNNLGYEGYSEYLVSKVLECSNVDSYVKYEQYTINGRAGCRSKSFIRENESYLSFQRLYDLLTGESLQERIRLISEVADRIGFVRKFVLENTGWDCSMYLSQILALDMLTLNTDRHFNNLGLIVDASTGIYKAAPIFDNGNSLLSDWDRFDEETVGENLEKVYGQPFSASLEMQAREAGIGLMIDYEKLQTVLEKEPVFRGVEVLKYQLKRYHNIITDYKMQQGNGLEQDAPELKL